ncbi:MAG: crossover junction endodeoxyribonuclease RuvC [Nitrospirae bacterium]|nr:crossover junction endodeoxyribonuclease RuvC [Nitrospirota bacterium]
MRVIGIDPGTLCCGYGIIETRTQNSELVYVASGEIRMKNTEALPERLKILYGSLKNVIDEYKPAHLCIEKIFYHKSIHSAFALGTARGIVMLLAAQNDIPVFECNLTELKMALTGYGRAEKRQVKEMVIRILNLKVANCKSQVASHRQQVTCSKLTEDASDALALCICHINSGQWKQDTGCRIQDAG